jgi:CheY-like chemotaxis protein
MTTPSPEKSSILIVDDMEENLVALEAVLGPLDQRLVRARSGEEALKAMLREEFAVVVLDVLMPGMDGFETATNIKRLDQTKDVPIILLTGTDADTDYAYRGYVIGAADFLTKPFDPWLLRTKVNIFLELHRKNRQLAVQAEQLRQLLVSGRGVSEQQEAEPGEPPPGAADRLPGRTPAGVAALNEQRLAEITDQLAQIELMLREDDRPDSTDLADRVGDLERVVDSLRAGQDTR